MINLLQFVKKRSLLTHVWESRLRTVSSTLDTAGGKTCGEVLFNAHEENDNRDGRKQGGGKEVLPFDHVKGGELRDADRDRPVGSRGDQHG